MTDDSPERKCDDCPRTFPAWLRTFPAWMLQPWKGRKICLSCLARAKRLERVTQKESER